VGILFLATLSTCHIFIMYYIYFVLQVYSTEEIIDSYLNKGGLERCHTMVCFTGRAPKLTHTSQLYKRRSGGHRSSTAFQHFNFKHLR
jgi:hypothetical protein